MNKFIAYIKHLHLWQFIGLFTLLAIIISEFLIVIQCYFLYGEIYKDFLIVGFFTSASCAFILLYITGLVLVQLREKDEKLQLTMRVFNEAQEGIFVTDEDGIIFDVNPMFSEITGYSREEVIGERSDFLNAGNQSPEFYNFMWQKLIDQGYWEGEVWNRKKSGEVYVEKLIISALPEENNNKPQYVGLFSDITQSKEHQKKIEFMAHYDELTKLPNRTLLIDRFNLAIGHSKRNKTLLVVCFLDLDNFKTINDTYGHGVGDKLLIKVTERIKSNIREEDTLSRQGGDEFVILLGEIHSPKHCLQILNRLQQVISQPCLIDDHTLNTSASTGATIFPYDDSDLDTLLRHADQAMYQAKLAGRNRYHLFNYEEDQKVIKKHHLLQRIQDALLRDEFCLYYQPKVNMKTGEIYGFEALIRWRHPEKGLILPLEFLPMVEGTDLEFLIGNWVIKEAVQQLGIWHEQGNLIEVSINISTYHLQSSSFFSELGQALASHPEIDSKYLQLEILESSILSDLNSVIRIIKKCKNKLGIHAALDDFGTGYSSLTHLRNLPVNTLKIDSSFVRNLLDDPNDFAIIEGVIGLAEAFNLQIIAEGVETKEHGLMLLAMGCDRAQGHSVALPMPSDEVVEWLNGYTPNEEWITSGNQAHSKENLGFMLFNLSANNWIKRFEEAINSLPGSVINWPTMEYTKCHCGAWIKKAKENKLFDAECLRRLENKHISMHLLANHLMKDYQSGEIETSRKELDELRSVFEALLNNFNEVKME